MRSTESTYGDSPLLAPGTVVTAKIVRPIAPKLRIQTDLGEFAVDPAPTIGKVQIEDFTGKFAFDRRGKNIAVDYLGSGGRRIPIGELGRELINKESKANLQSGSNLLRGTLSRGLNEKILEIQVQSLIDHQPVANIDRGKLIPLPQQSLLPDRQNPAVSSARRYFPTAGELRQLYQTSELAGDIAKMAEIKSLGLLLNDVYPDGNRAPDNFSHWVVEIPVPDKSVVQSVAPVHQYVSGVDKPVKNYQPNLGEVMRWCGSSDLARNLEAKEIALSLLQQLRAEFKTSGREQAPPRDYSSPNVVVSDSIRGQMAKIVQEQTNVVVPRVEIQQDLDHER